MVFCILCARSERELENGSKRPVEAGSDAIGVSQVTDTTLMDSHIKSGVTSRYVTRDCRSFLLLNGCYDAQAHGARLRG